MLFDPKAAERLELGRRCFVLRVPLPIERAKWKAAIRRAGGRQYGQLSLLALLRSGTEDLMSDSAAEIRDAVLAMIDAHRDNLQAMHRIAVEGDVDDDETRQGFIEASQRTVASALALAGIERAVIEGSPAYADAAADEEVFHQIAGIEGARLFLAGLETLDGKEWAPDPRFKRAGNLVSDATLATISDPEFHHLGLKLQAMSYVSETQRKNSSSPLVTRPSGETSKATSQVTAGLVPNSE